MSESNLMDQVDLDIMNRWIMLIQICLHSLLSLLSCLAMLQGHAEA